MKILQIIQKPQFRGAEIFACQLSEELMKLGHEVDVLFLFGNEEESLPFSLCFIYLKASIKNRFWDFKSYKKLNVIIRDGNYDIVQANAGDTLKYAALSRYFYSWKSKLVYRNANKISDFLTSTPKKLFNNLLMKQVDYVASVSSECMNDFLTIYPYFQNRIECLPIGVGLQTLAPYSSLSVIGVEGVGPFLLHVASFVPEKNHSGLLRIFSELLIDYPAAKLLLVGEGKLKPAIEVLAAEMKLESMIHFLGKRNDVLQIMSCCNVFVLPSLIEGLPGVILESFVNNLPVVAYDVGGIKEIVLDKKTGWLVTKNDESGFLMALKESLSTENKTIMRNAYFLVNSNYSNVVIANQFLGFYKKGLTVNHFF